MRVQRSQTVVVVGAGLAGLSAAFHLADKGVGRVVLLDKEGVGAGSSSRSGAVNTMLMASENATRARGVSFDIFERFDRILDKYDFHQEGCLGIYKPDQLEVAAQLHEMQRRVGARFEVLDSKEIETRFPDLRLAEDEAGVLDLRGGWSEPERYIPALEAEVRRLGGEVRLGRSVEDFIVEQGQVRGVRLEEGGEVRADATVCTVNAWANALLEHVGQAVPARSFVHERFVTKRLGRRPRLPAVNDDATGIYYRPTEGGSLLLGSGAIEPEQVFPGIDFVMDGLEPAAQSLPFILRAAAGRLPLMREAEMDYHRVGLVSYPVDFMPVIGPVAALPGLYLGTHFCSGGFGWHPVAGRLIAEHIVDGATSIDADDFSPDRFGDVDTEGYLARDVSYRQMIEDYARRSKGFVRKRH